MWIDILHWAAFGVFVVVGIEGNLSVVGTISHDAYIHYMSSETN